MKDELGLSAAIGNLYKSFARYPLRKHVEGCPCCVKIPDRRALEAKPLRQLSSANLTRFAFKAMTTWGEKDDFRHFLPRIFELTVSAEGIGCDVEVVFEKLAIGEWKQWPEPERSALQEFFLAGWHWLLLDADPGITPDSWLCGLGRAGEDLSPYLEDWKNSRASTAYEHLVSLVKWHQPAYIKRHSLTNSFWPDSPLGVAQLCNWLADPKTRARLEEIYFENELATFAPALANAIEQLEGIGRA